MSKTNMVHLGETQKPKKEATFQAIVELPGKERTLLIDPNGRPTFKLPFSTYDNMCQKERVFKVKIAVDKDKSLKGEELRTQWVEMMDILHVSEKDRK